MKTARSNPAINAWDPTWVQFIDNPDELQTFKDWGYFSLPLKYTRGNFTATTLISLKDPQLCRRVASLGNGMDGKIDLHLLRISAKKK